MRSFITCRRCLLIGVLFGACAIAQTYTTSVADGIMPIGIGPAAAYPLTGFEHYDPFSGALNSSLPLHHIGGRGEAGFDLVWHFQQTWMAAKRFGGPNFFIPIDPYPNQNLVGPQGVAGPLGAGAVFNRTGSTFGVCPTTSSSGITATLARIVFEEPSGAQLELVSTQNASFQSIDACQPTPASVDAQRGRLFRSTEGGMIEFWADSPILDYTSPGFGEADTPVSGDLLFPNGTTYRIDNSVVSWIRDRNGNLITFQYGSAQTKATWYFFVPVPTQITDSLGRVTTINYNDSSCGGCTTITYPGAGGVPHVIQIVQAHLSAGLLRSDYSSVATIDQLFPNTGQATSNFDPVLASYIQLPDGSRFSFQYNPYGELARITLPTGGAIEYDYGEGYTVGGGGFEGSTTDNNPVMIYRRLQQRREYANGGSNFTSRTRYSASYQSGNLTATELLEEANGATIGKTVHTLQGSPLDALTMTGVSCNPWNEGLENQTDYGLSSAQTPLVSVVHSWVQGSNCRNNPQIASETTTLKDTNQVSKREFAFDAYNNLSDLYEYDWGAAVPGALIRHKHTVYYWSADSTFASAQSYLVRLPYDQITYDENGIQVAETSWHYDENPPQDISGLPGHDSAFGVARSTRGNVTSEWRWLKNQSAWTAVGTLRTFDIAGNVLTQQDPNGNVTTFAYNDGQNEYAFPVSVTNALGQTTHIDYDYNIGKPVSSIDPNGVSTAYSYSDSLDRLTQIRRAAGASGVETQTNYSYPSPNQVNTSQDQIATGDGRLATVRIFDGLGREIKDQQYETGSQFVEIDKTYDAAGRLATTTNPSRPGDGLGFATTYSFDSLGRPAQIQTADGSATTMSYSGSATSVTDPAGAVKKYSYDAAGRLLNVREDPSGLDYTTDYRYDALDNLVLVSQGYCPSCQQRHFSYDALSRLTQSENPESGTVLYAYDANGNVTARIDARGITANYAYDALNRLASKSYADSTPAVTYSYDDPAVPNSAGRLTQVTNGLSTARRLEYDALGRVTASQQSTSEETYHFSYAYNLAGALVSETYPSGRTITTDYDQANRVNAVSGTFVGAPTNYASGVMYAPQGAPSFLWYGNQMGRSFTYNSRLQLSCYWDAVQNSPSNYLYQACPDWGTTNNNGNLRGETIYAGGPGQLNTLAQFTRSYSYDAANRLTQASDSGGWSRTFQYDAWGNMWVPVTGVGGVPLAGNTPTANVFNGQNRITGAAYDAAGNQTDVNGFAVVYDAENRQASVTENPALGGGQELYVYDGDGQRVEKIGLAGNTIYVYDAFGQLAAEYNTFVSPTPPCQTCYFSVDHLGSLRMVTDQSGNVVARHDFLPFGEEVPGGAAGRNSQWGAADSMNQRFTGQIRDPQTGLDYFNARYFGSALGRFTGADPENAGADRMNPQTWNGYAYVGNNPMGYVDLDGRFASMPGPVLPPPPPFVPGGPIPGGFIPGPHDGIPTFSVTKTAKKDIPIVNMPITVNLVYGSTIALPKNGFQKQFLPPNAQVCFGNGNPFYAPPNFDMSKIVAAGKSGGWNPFAANRGVGHYGTFDFQRSKDSSGNTTFYSGYTPASNFAVGAYLYGAGFDKETASLIANTFATTMSSNAGDPEQAVYRNMGYDMAASGWIPQCGPK